MALALVMGMQEGFTVGIIGALMEEVFTVRIIGVLWRKTMERCFICTFTNHRTSEQKSYQRSPEYRTNHRTSEQKSYHRSPEYRTNHRNQPAEILSEISRVQNQSQIQRAEILSEISRVQNQQAEIFSGIQNILNQQAEILSFCRLQNQNQNQQEILSKILSKEGLLSEPGKMDIINPMVAGKMDIINLAAPGKMNIINPVLPDPACKDRFIMKMEGSSMQHRSQNQQAEILSKEGLLSEPGKMNIINTVLRDPAGKDSIKFSLMKMDGSSIQHRSQNQPAEILWKGFLSEPEKNYIQSNFCANACVVTPSRELQTDELTTVNLYGENAPSVVCITNFAVRQPVLTDPHLEERGYGTGFIWDDKGHIVTNYHVIQDYCLLRVKLHDQSEYNAKVIGWHQDTDVAVLSIDTPKKLRPVLVGSSGNLLVGQKVYAIGNPFRYDGTLTTGVISGLGRKIISPGNDHQILSVIQTDAAINPGNSGGPLFDSSGYLIGINTAISSTSGASTGVGFSIPVDTFSSLVRWILNQLAWKNYENHTGIRFASGVTGTPDGPAGKADSWARV